VEPKWRRDGRELYYLSLDGKLMSVSISSPAFTAGRPVELFQTPPTVNAAQPHETIATTSLPTAAFSR
jgi:hypothetical protein